MQQLKTIFRPVYAPILRSWRRRATRQAEQRRIRQAVRRARAAGDPVKIIIGAGQTNFVDWIATDIPAFDLRNQRHWLLLFPPQSIDRILAEHVFEHLTTAQLAAFLRTARAYLAPSGRIRIAVPDGYHPDPDYIARVRPGGSGKGAEDHKVLYTADLMSDLLHRQGYQFELLEYFDAAGQFHQHSWKPEDGLIHRSAAHDPRNADGNLNYTSLIVDCWL